jgi:predicted MPP superfamily phosphohydrolase
MRLRDVVRKPKGKTYKPRLAPFLRVLVAWSAVTHVAVALAIAEIARRVGLPAAWVVGVAGAVALLVPLGRLLRSIVPDRRRSRWRVRLFDEPYFVHWSAANIAFLGTAACALVWAALSLAMGRPAFGLPRAALIAYGVGLAIAAWGVLVGRRLVRVRRLEVRMRGLDPAFDGYRIVHLTDLHVGSFDPAHTAARWVAIANAQKPDLVAVTGDLVTSGGEHVADAVRALGRLRARDGVLVTPGNHDYFGDPHALMGALEARGVRVLRNASVRIRRGDASILVAGADDTWTRRANVARALAGRSDGVPAILLAHDPELFAAAVREGVALQLSGHTHGGQIALPFAARLWNLSKWSHRFTVGLYRSGDAWLYVSQGLGTTGPPIRIGTRPEVAVIRLRAVG